MSFSYNFIVMKTVGYHYNFEPTILRSGFW